MTPDPVGLPGLAALSLGMLAFFAALAWTRWHAPAEQRSGGGGGRRSRASIVGIVLQGFAIALCGVGPARVLLDPLSAKALVEAAAVLLLLGGAVALFLWSSTTMGRNWSVVARTRDDHSLVTAGPFAYVRHPIYVALFLFAPALAIATGHVRMLLIAIPIYAIGTAIRVRIEERLLRDAFGADYDEYATRVRRFIPGVV